MRILIVEDEPHLGSAVQERLREAGHAVDWFMTLADARAILLTMNYDVVVLDLGLPDGSGRTLLRELRRARSTVAVLITTAQDQISDRIAGLSEGADDYIVKPYDLDELSARVDAVSRRYGGGSGENEILLDDGLALDLSRHRLSHDGTEIDLTAREWAVIEALARRPGAVCSRERLEDALYGLGEEVESNAIEVFISRLRKKLGSGTIITVRGRGYRLAEPRA
ncbi:response regulator transcription factor [Gluconobacter wancherniae]|uniref:response regulator transcription factor n=1 Tax=Gluconobacter wancherniae TaxID=1307955 RepID=UPI0030A3699A